VLVDGASTDNTLEILEEYRGEPCLRWISEPDNDANEGFRKALDMTHGEYVMCLPILKKFGRTDYQAIEK